MRTLFKILSLARWVRAAGKGTLPQRYIRNKGIRAIDRYIR